MPQRFQSLRMAWAALMILIASIAFVASADAAETQASAERSERRAFIEKATQEQWDRVREAVNEMAKRGIYPSMIVATLQPFADWDYFVVAGGRITWEPNSGQKYKSVVVPEGFVTDLASIPRVFWQVLRPEGRHAYAAVVHDYLYWTQSRSREEADMIFKFALQDSKVPSKTVETLYLAVRGLGQSSWDKNAQLTKAGECRLLKRLPTDFTTSWNEWKKQPDVCESK
jgi:Protein of unknown function (DUF1353)